MAGAPAIVLSGGRPAGSPGDSDAQISLRVEDGAISPSSGTHPRDRLVDLDGAYVTPGLVDMHVHLDRGEPGADHSSPREANLAAHLRAGVTAVRSLGGGGVAPESSGLPSPSPRTVSAGRALTRVGGYGAFLGREVSEDEDPERVVAEEVSRGAGVIKVLLSGGVDFSQGMVEKGCFSSPFLRRIVEAAAEAGLSVAAHANGPEAVAQAVRAGVSTIEHGLLIGRPELEAMGRAGVVWVPTLLPLAVLLERRDEFPMIDEIWSGYLESVALGRELGLEICAGTDGGAPGAPHGSLSVELRLLALAGFSPSELRDCCTRRPGGLLSTGGLLPAGYGSFDTGVETDLVWFGEDPFDPRPPAGSGLVEAGRLIAHSPPAQARGAVVCNRLVWWSDH